MTIDKFGFEWTLLLMSFVLLIITKLLIAVYLGKKLYEQKKEIGVIKFDFLLGTFIFLLGLLISRVIFIYFDFFLTSFNSDLYYLGPNIIAWKIGIIIAHSGGTCLLLIAEKKILKFKSKGLLAFIFMGVSLFIFLYPVSNASEFNFISTIEAISGVTTVILPFIYLYAGFRTPVLRKASFLMAFGFSLVLIGLLFLVQNYNLPSGSKIFVYFMHTIIKILGYIIFTLGVLNFSKVEEDEIPEQLKVLTYYHSKPKNITEEEVTFYREQKICLVCKGKAIGRTFIHVCDALYCLKCADALIQIDNMCWACENALDKTKPVKLAEWVENNVAHVLPDEDEDEHKKKK